MNEKITVDDIKGLNWVEKDNITYTKIGDILIYISVPDDNPDIYCAAIHYGSKMENIDFSSLDELLKWLADRVDVLYGVINRKKFVQETMLSSLRRELNMKIKEISILE